MLSFHVLNLPYPEIFISSIAFMRIKKLEIISLSNSIWKFLEFLKIARPQKGQFWSISLNDTLRVLPDVLDKTPRQNKMGKVIFNRSIVTTGTRKITLQVDAF